MSNEDSKHLPTSENMMKLFGLNETQALAAVKTIEETKRRERSSEAQRTIRSADTTLNSFLREFHEYGETPVSSSIVSIARLLEPKTLQKLLDELEGERIEADEDEAPVEGNSQGAVADLRELHKRSDGQWFELEKILAEHPKRFKGVSVEETKKALISILVHTEGIQETGRGKKKRSWKVETEKGAFRITNLLSRHL